MEYFGPRTSTEVQMKGHILHLSWLHMEWFLLGNCWLQFRSYEHVMNICVSFICNQWSLAKDFNHLRMSLPKTPVFQNDVPYMDCRWVVQKTPLFQNDALYMDCRWVVQKTPVFQNDAPYMDCRWAGTGDLRSSLSSAADARLGYNGFVDRVVSV